MTSPSRSDYVLLIPAPDGANRDGIARSPTDCLSVVSYLLLPPSRWLRRRLARGLLGDRTRWNRRVVWLWKSPRGWQSADVLRPGLHLSGGSGASDRSSTSSTWSGSPWCSASGRSRCSRRSRSSPARASDRHNYRALRPGRFGRDRNCASVRPRVPRTVGRLPRPSPGLAIAAAAAIGSVIILVALFRVARVMPLGGGDSWDSGYRQRSSLRWGIGDRLFPTLPGATYPLLVPALLAMDFRFMGSASAPGSRCSTRISTRRSCLRRSRFCARWFLPGSHGFSSG